MPYIKPEDRRQVWAGYKYGPAGTPGPDTAGELNYVLTKVLLEWVKYRTGKVGKLKYCILNDAMGAIEGAKLEFYRRMVAPYEDTKIIENGDVYPQ